MLVKDAVERPERELNEVPIEGDGEDEEKENADEDEADLSASSGFKPKLRAQETSIPGRGSGASHRNKRRR